MIDRVSYPRLPSDWRRVEVATGADPERPGIYKWSIEGCGAYIGKYKRIKRPMAEYERNVSRLLSGLSYRKSKPDDYRRVHRELARAVRDGRAITLLILENPPEGELNARELELIRQCGSLNDPPFGGRPISI